MRLAQLLPIAMIVFLAISAIYALSVLNVYWMGIAFAALTVSLIPTFKGGAMFGAHSLWVPAIISGPYLLGIVAYAFGFEPFDLKSPIFWIIGSVSLFALSLMMIDTIVRTTAVSLNTAFIVIFSFVLYEALLALQGPVDYYVNGHIGSSYFSDNDVLMGYLIVCTAIGFSLTVITRVRMGLITLFQMPGKGAWRLKGESNMMTTVFFTILLAAILVLSQLGDNKYSLMTGIISIGLLWVPQGMDMRGMIRLPKLVLVFIGLSLFLNSLGVVTGLYESTFWWDKLTHIMSGFAVAGIATVALLLLSGLGKMTIPAHWYVFFIFIIVMFFEAFWEILEFTLDNTIGTSMQYGRMDTVNDLLSDGIAGLVAGAGAAVYVKRVDPDEYIESCEAERVTQIFDGPY